MPKKGPRIRNKAIRRVKVADLEDAPWNFRTHPEAQAKALDGAIEELGFYGYPDVWQPGRGRYQLCDGHLRKERLLAKYGDNATIEVNVTDFNEEEAKKATATKDPLAAMAETDLTKLDALMGDIEFDDENLSKMLADLDGKPRQEIIEDDVPEPPVDPITKPGDLWLLGEHRLLCGDSTKAEDVARVMDGERAGITFTDPPYNVGIEYGTATNDSRSRESYSEWCSKWTSRLPSKALLTVGIKRLLWWGDILGEPQWIIAWVKRNGQGQTGLGGTNKWDAILAYGVPCDHDTDIIEVSNDYAEGIKSQGDHPTAKPVKLWASILSRFGLESEIIYEPFSGSGTTLIAAEQLSRRCYAIEIEPRYVDVAVQRWEKLTGKKAKHGTRS